MNISIKIIYGPFLVLIMASSVVFLQYYLLHDSLTLGFKPDDWILYFAYKTLGSNPLSQIGSVWAERGLYTTYQVYYMGLLDSLFGLNYYAFHLSNLALKIIATLGLYPLILLLFKNRLLAALTVILFSISHASVGPLEFVVKGSDYLSIFFMEGFLLIYYFLISNRLRSIKYCFLLFVLFVLSFASSPIRMFPLFVVPLMVEIFLILKNLRKASVNKSVSRFLVLYIPFIVAFLFMNNRSLTGDAYGPVGVIKSFLEGNLYLIIAPFSGMGYSFFTNDYLVKIFGTIVTESFKDYLFFILGGPTIICGLVTVLVSWSLIPTNKFLFFIFSTAFNFVAEILFFFIASSNASYDAFSLYSVIFGGFILIVGFLAFLFWLTLKKSKDRILASFWTGTALLFIFTFLTWFFAPLGTSFTPTSYYLVVASVGSALMTAAFFMGIYNKTNLVLHNQLIVAPLLFIVLILIFVMSSSEIRQRYYLLNKDGRGADGQIIMQTEARRVFGNFKEGDQALVFFDTSDITGNGPFYSEGFLTSFPFFMHFRGNKIIDGCIGVIYEDDKMVELRKLVQIKSEIKGFEHSALCVSGQKGGIKSLFFTPDQFYAFKIEDKKLVDIKKEILDHLEIDYSN